MQETELANVPNFLKLLETTSLANIEELPISCFITT